VTAPGGSGMTDPDRGTRSGRPASLASAAGSAGLESSIARVLTIGTYASIALLAVGVALMLAAGIGPLSGGPDFDAGRLVGDLVALRPAGFIWLGLLAVIATPSARVAASLIGYQRRGEGMMTLISGLILIVIAASVVLATVAKSLEG
jgi:uncharacterized membrane protein